MSDNTEALPQGGQTVAEGNTQAQQPQPRNDIEAQRMEADAAAQQPAADKDKADAERKRNRTRDYIQRLNAENAEYRRKIADIEARLPKAPEPKGAPKPEDFNFDEDAYQRAKIQHELAEARKQWDAENQTKAEAQKQQETANAYAQRANAFAAIHEDYLEVVGSMDPSLLLPELQAAIIAHEKGPEIAYRLAQNEDELLQLASTRPELLERALARYAARMSDAPPEPIAPAAAAANALATPAIATQPKPISQAPAPAPRVGGRAPAETPPEKLTDDQWYARDRERRRKR
ncbi:hypothetical protein ACP93_02625 [Xanthomonas sp. NCPPB 1128]|uniref:hypothetical protein n=1 Tax=Xanthomonas sp. NCPPB 1128 TaxID=1775876 RepID=UPI00065AC5FD|nr:hypothetical protein [Xanthomonas sp. NCPPB 1128]KMM77076.1 hypothetical protein ACP93_02360 [Xanthomonas sp. NCPPB 1128]KMM77120.1 hypothetical protein ACP93_02625 [Xanthomonas sp. NCPPB 1128]